MFKAGVSDVRVDVQVTEGKNLVNGLSKDDFIVTDENQPQSIVHFSHGEERLKIGLDRALAEHCPRDRHHDQPRDDDGRSANAHARIVWAAHPGTASGRSLAQCRRLVLAQRDP